MKFLIILTIFIFTGLLFISSCTKYKEYCWECNIQSFELQDEQWKKVADSTTVQCGLDEEDMHEYESLGTQINDPVGTSTTTRCQKSN